MQACIRTEIHENGLCAPVDRGISAWLCRGHFCNSSAIYAGFIRRAELLPILIFCGKRKNYV